VIEDELVPSVFGIYSSNTVIAGVCEKDLIHLSRKADAGTEYHEAFHRMFEILMPEKIVNHIRK